MTFMTDLHCCKSKGNLTLSMQILHYPPHHPDRPLFPFFSTYGSLDPFLKIKQGSFYNFFIFGGEVGIK